MSLVGNQEDGRDGRGTPEARGDGSSAASGCATRSTGVANRARPARGRGSFPGDVNELSVDERSIASCRLPTSLKNEGATLFSFSVQ
jgi:hypothetical protein